MSKSKKFLKISYYMKSQFRLPTEYTLIQDIV